VKANEQPKVEEKKEPVKVDFVPDPDFDWGLDLEAIDKSKKKKRKNDESSIPVVIKQDPGKAYIKEDVKLKLSKDLSFSTTVIDKVNKGLKNSTNCCFMNVCLQSLLSIPAFFNMLEAISEN
jgi:ubiquitin C-terminal hydrolase